MIGTFWGTKTPSEGPSALDKINVRRMIAHIQSELERGFDRIAEIEKAPYSKPTLAFIKQQVEFARKTYSNLPNAKLTGGIIDRFIITRELNDRRWVIRATMMYDDGSQAQDAEFRSRRQAGAWARRVIREGLVDLDLEFTPVRPAEHITITTSVAKEGEFDEHTE
jgi:phage tail sheath protein FI